MPRKPAKPPHNAIVFKAAMNPDELLKNAEVDRAFVTTNEHKQARERWVLDHWLAARRQLPREIATGDDPPDFCVDGRGVEVVEAMEPGRRRGDEYNAKVEAGKEGNAVARRLPSLDKVRRDGHSWILGQVQKKAAKPYDAEQSANWTLLVYANFSRADQIQWELLEAKVLELRPQFFSVEVVYNTATGDVARTVFVARKE